jgi:hypothetical protein
MKKLRHNMEIYSVEPEKAKRGLLVTREIREEIQTLLFWKASALGPEK